MYDILHMHEYVTDFVNVGIKVLNT